MARTRFASDAGLTARMTSVMFLLGGIFVALIVILMFVLPPTWAPFIGLIGLGIAWWQWYNSDTVAMRAMRAREVTPEEAPELHAMIDRLCTLADMPKPRVGIADVSVPNAFATGRSPDHAVVCVTTGILGKLTAEELEGVLAHELSHVAHRDVDEGEPVPRGLPDAIHRRAVGPDRDRRRGQGDPALSDRVCRGGDAHVLLAVRRRPT